MPDPYSSWPPPTLREHSASQEERAALTRTLFLELSDTRDPGLRRCLHERIVLVNLCVADAIANSYAGRGVDRDDLQQVSRLALVRAVSQFDSGRGSDFLSFAVPSMRGELRRYFRDHGWVVRPPRRVQEARLAMRRMGDQIEQSEGRLPSRSDFRALGIDCRTIREVEGLASCFTPDSLDRPAHPDGGSASIGEQVPTSDNALDQAEARLVLAPVLARLADRDRLVLRLRYVEGLTQREVGEQIGVTQMQVSRILGRVIRELRELTGNGAVPGGIAPQ